MPRYDYIALNTQGREVRGSIEAPDLANARETLRGRALMPMELELEGMGSGGKLGWRVLNPSRYLPVSSRDKQFMFRQLAMMMKAGHRLRGALEMLERVSLRHRLSKALLRIIERIDHGNSFADAIRAEGKLFPGYVPALIAAGERSGTLDQILDQIAASLERSRMLRNTLMRALVMPSITLLVAFAVLSFVVLWLVPKLTDFLVRGGGEIHWTMQILVSVNAFFLDHGRIIAIIIGATAFALAAIYTTTKGKLILDRIWLALPIFGRTSVMYEMSRFGGVGMLLIRSGLRQVEALRVIAEVTQNAAFQRLYEGAADRLLSGQQMGAALEAPIFDKMAQHMVEVGESSGSLDEVLDTVGAYFTDEVETRIQVLFSTLVPAMTILVGLVVAIIYLSVILTILGAVNSVR